MALHLFRGLNYLIIRRDILEKNFSEEFRNYDPIEDVCRFDRIDFYNFLLNGPRFHAREVIFDDYLVAFSYIHQENNDLECFHYLFCRYGMDLWRFTAMGADQAEWVDGCLLEINEYGEAVMRGPSCDWLDISQGNAVLRHTSDNSGTITNLADCAFRNESQKNEFIKAIEDLQSHNYREKSYIYYNGLRGRLHYQIINDEGKGDGITFHAAGVSKICYVLKQPDLWKYLPIVKGNRWMYPMLFDLHYELI